MFQSGVNPLNDTLRGGSNAIHKSKNFRIQRIEGDGNAIQASHLELFSVAGEHGAIGGHRQISFTGDLRKHGHKVMESTTKERLASREAEFFHTHGTNNARKLRDFFQRQYLGLG